MFFVCVSIETVAVSSLVFVAVYKVLVSVSMLAVRVSIVTVAVSTLRVGVRVLFPFASANRCLAVRRIELFDESPAMRKQLHTSNAMHSERRKRLTMFRSFLTIVNLVLCLRGEFDANLKFILLRNFNLSFLVVFF